LRGQTWGPDGPAQFTKAKIQTRGSIKDEAENVYLSESGAQIKKGEGGEGHVELATSQGQELETSDTTNEETKKTRGKGRRKL